MTNPVEMIPIYIMGKHYMVPGLLTIMDAMEFAGYHLIRGCGCRAGFCGACATVYRTAGDNQLKAGLACQTAVTPEMYLTLIPFFPALKGRYAIDELPPTASSLARYYPEIYRCIGCNACTQICPQDLKVMQYIAYAQRGKLKRCAEESFGCIMCGLCATRCPAHIGQYFVGILARRLYGKHILPRAFHLEQRVKEIREGKYEPELESLIHKTLEELKELYNSREIEA